RVESVPVGTRPATGLRVPRLRAVSASHGAPEHRVWPAARLAESGTFIQRRRGRTLDWRVPPRARRPALPAPTVGLAAPAHGVRGCAGQRPDCAAARRAVCRAGQGAARTAAPGAEGAAGATAHSAASDHA